MLQYTTEMDRQERLSGTFQARYPLIAEKLQKYSKGAREVDFDEVIQRIKSKTALYGESTYSTRSLNDLEEGLQRIKGYKESFSLKLIKEKPKVRSLEEAESIKKRAGVLPYLDLAMNSKQREKIQSRLTYSGEFPSVCGKLNQLTRLDLSHNFLSQVPGAIFQLTNLKELNLSNNALQTLESDFEKLNELVVLDLSHNQIEEISFSIEKLINLRFLHLEHNKLGSLPFAKLAPLELKKIYFRGNKELQDWIWKIYFPYIDSFIPVKLQVLMYGIFTKAVDKDIRKIVSISDSSRTENWISKPYGKLVRQLGEVVKEDILDSSTIEFLGFFIAAKYAVGFFTTE